MLVAAGLQVLVTGAYVVHLELFADFESRYGASQLAVLALLGRRLLLSNEAPRRLPGHAAALRPSRGEARLTLRRASAESRRAAACERLV